MAEHRFNVERTRAGQQFVIPGTEKPIPVPSVKYSSDGSQFVIPGTEQVSGRVLLDRFMQMPLRPRVGQRSLAATPLFGSPGSK